MVMRPRMSSSPSAITMRLLPARSGASDMQEHHPHHDDRGADQQRDAAVDRQAVLPAAVPLQLLLDAFAQIRGWFDGTHRAPCLSVGSRSAPTRADAAS